ncbi:MAG: hypothetical protein R2857_01780 [Vampirovibrionales bacterium]
MGAERKLDGIIDHLNSPWSILYAGSEPGVLMATRPCLKPYSSRGPAGF